jgi:predicted component of type VI protein secretion system
VRTLKVSSGPSAGQSLEVEHEVVIGRENADLTISDPEISRRHALVRPIERGIEVEDLGSMNGTFVNGKRIGEAVELTVGGTVRVGNSDIEVELELVDVTKVREIPDPAVTRARNIVADVDDRTRMREAQSQPAPPGAQPPPAAQPPPVPPAAQPPPAPQPVAQRPPPPAPAPPAAPAPETGRRRGIPKPALVLIGVLVVAAIVAILLLFVL